MKLTPFNLDLWLHLGKPKKAWTREGNKVKELTYHPEAHHIVGDWVLTGIIIDEKLMQHKLALWNTKGEHHLFKLAFPDVLFGPNDLMIHLEDKPKIPWIRKK